MEERPVIRLLPDQVINKIAAGEVVERPASVAKELLENALDAGAKNVTVEFVQGGRRLVAVTDDGFGMTRDQALLAIERHATSKIRTEEDVERIGTMGFRGEALAAISSISRFTLVTRPPDSLSGTEIRMAGGKLLSVEEIGCPPGTRIEVRDLFFNVPARRKFLRAEQTEAAQIRQTFLVHALARTEFGMTLKADDRLVYRLPRGPGVLDRIAELYSPAFAERLMPFERKTDAYAIRGFAGLPQTARKDRGDQYVFVNGRPAAAPLVYHAVNEVYRALVGRGRYPALFLFLEMDPSLVDVNVHPAKKEVRFRYPNRVRDAIVAALEGAFGAPGTDAGAPGTSSFSSVAHPPRIERQERMEAVLVRPELVGNAKPASEVDSRERADDPDPEAAFAPEGSPWTHCRIVGRIGPGYVVLETDDGFVLMEPRAAHERVLFERLMAAAERGETPAQKLLAPETVALLPADAQTVREQLDALRELGFGIAPFGGDAFIVDALPATLGDRSAEPLLTEIVRELARGGRREAARTTVRERIARAACRMAVCRKERLSDEALERLVNDLARTEMPYLSPFGRPTLVFTGFAELDRRFSRER